MTTIINEKQGANDAIVGCEYVFPVEITTETRVNANKVAFILATGKAWKPIYFTPGSALLTMQESTGFQGRLIESKFEMKVPGGSADLSTELGRICGRSIVLKLTFESGAIMICGGKNRKLILVNSATINTQKGNVVGFTYKNKNDFKWMSV